MKPVLVTKVFVVVLAFSASFVMARKEIKNVLHFEAISGYNHKDGIRAGGRALDNLAAQHGFTVKHSTTVADFSNLEQFDVVIFNNNVSNGGMQGIIKDKKDQQALIDYMEGGGLYLGFHGANDFDCTGWEWYYKTLHSGNCFRGHGGGVWTLETDKDLADDKQLAAMWEDANLGKDVTFDTEKYRMRKGNDPSVRDDPGVKVMQGLIKANSDYDDHYFTWTKPIGEGRMIYTGLGHGEGDFIQNDAWLEKATWYWMKYLAGHYAEVSGCMVKGDPNYDSNATIACDTCCAPCCKTPGFVETNITNCNNPKETECKTVSVDRVALSPSLVNITSDKISIIYPNPYQVRVLNVNGETVFAESSRGMNEYSLSGLQAGLYFVKIVSEGNSVSRRILVH